MNIACVGWGSLIWDRRNLPLRSCWHRDGPLLPVEFARLSSGHRITLVLVAGTRPVPTLWALLDISDLAAAREALRQREGKNVALREIGFWSASDRTLGDIANVIGEWAQQHNLDGAVWTSLPPKWGDVKGVVPTPKQVLDFLRQQGTGSEAERYIRKAPAQVRTPYRENIEAALG